jgi:hypothetical protein
MNYESICKFSISLQVIDFMKTVRLLFLFSGILSLLSTEVRGQSFEHNNSSHFESGYNHSDTNPPRNPSIRMVNIYYGIGVPFTVSSSHNSLNGQDYYFNFSSCKNYGILTNYSFPHSNFGLAVEANYNYDAFDFNNFFFDGTPFNFQVQNESSSYFKMYSLLGGFFWSSGQSDYILSIRFLMGYTRFQSPDVQYNGIYSQGGGSSASSSTVEYYEFMPVTTSIFSIDFGASLNFKLIKGFYGFLSIDYYRFNGKINTSMVEATTYSTSTTYGPNNTYVTTTSYNPTSQTTPFSYNVPADIFSGSIGIGYSFGK